VQECRSEGAYNIGLLKRDLLNPAPSPFAARLSIAVPIGKLALRHSTTHLAAMSTFIEHASQPEASRDVGAAIRRGLAGRCPHCGTGRLFGRFLKVVPACATCAERLDVHRADDLPAYLVILIVGHVVVGAMLAFETFDTFSTSAQMFIWPTLTLVLALLLLQPVKGAIIALQWALHMHGFGAPHPLEHE